MALERVLETEVMDSQQDAFDYDTMDHSSVNRVFVDDLLAAMQGSGDREQGTEIVLPSQSTIGTSLISAPARL